MSVDGVSNNNIMRVWHVNAAGRSSLTQCTLYMCVYWKAGGGGGGRSVVVLCVIDVGDIAFICPSMHMNRSHKIG